MQLDYSPVDGGVAADRSERGPHILQVPNLEREMTHTLLFLNTQRSKHVEQTEVKLGIARSV